jgi:cellulose synthase/poly-beta-1,6-N-acetylglucosamine synthase-like glycosyltransferase
MTQVSVITALADRPGHRLAEVHAALNAGHGDWEWLIQLDGTGEHDLPATVAEDPRVRIASNGRQLGIAATRNRALARCAAPLLLGADSDDLLLPEAIGALLPAFADPTVGLAFGDWVEYWPDREPFVPKPRFVSGRIPAGTLSRIWAAERWVPMHLAGAMWRTDAVLAVGGWSAIVAGSDIGLMLGVDAAWCSSYVPVRTFMYHHHAEQVTASRAFQAQFDIDMEFLVRREQALRATRGQAPGAGTPPA